MATIESVLEQFSALTVKDQQKFSSEMTRFLQGQPKKTKAKKEVIDSDEEKPKKPRSEGQIAWTNLLASIRATLVPKYSSENEKGKMVFPTTMVMTTAAHLKESGQMEPSAKEIDEAYKYCIANPQPSKMSLKKSGSDGGSVASSKKEEPKAKEPKKEAPKKEEPKKEEPKAKEPKATPKKAPKKALPPPPAEEDSSELTTERWSHEGKTYARNVVEPFYCWDLQDMTYMGVWDAESKAFDDSIDDPTA